ncbi:MAG: sugar ABC transporter substrate-binding protein [Firmicutes bacterium]|nr:sugar ABC transporter substrate-binding protein [Bacillota bacterium]
MKTVSAMRISKIAFLVVLMLLTVSVVSYGASMPSADQAKINWKQASGQSIRIMACARPAITYLKSLLPEFEALTGIKVTIDDYPEGEFFKKIVIDLSSGKPVSDAFMLSHAYTVMYAEGKWVEPLKPYLENPKLTDAAWYDFNDYPKGSLRDATWKGVLYGVPIAPDTQILMYRKDLFKSKGLDIPKDMNELYQAAVKLNDPPKMAGIVLRLLRGSGTHWPWNGYVQNYGGYWIDPEDNPQLNSKPTIEATKMYIKLLKDAGPAGAVNYSWYECASDFQQGKAAIFGGDSNIFMSQFENPKGSAVAGKVGYAILPAAPNGHHAPAAGTAWYWGMSSKSSKKIASWLFIQWATSKELALKLGLETTEIMRNSVWQSEALRQKYPVPDWIKASSETMNKFSASYAFPMVKEFAPLADIAEVALQEIYLGKMTVEEAMADAQAKSLKAMRK